MLVCSCQATTDKGFFFQVHGYCNRHLLSRSEVVVQHFFAHIFITFTKEIWGASDRFSQHAYLASRGNCVQLPAHKVYVISEQSWLQVAEDILKQLNLLVLTGKQSFKVHIAKTMQEIKKN